MTKRVKPYRVSVYIPIELNDVFRKSCDKLGVDYSPSNLNRRAIVAGLLDGVLLAMVSMAHLDPKVVQEFRRLNYPKRRRLVLRKKR